MEIFKDCKSCTYYVQHFVKNKNRFAKINFGHCSKKYRITKPELCDNWEAINIIEANKEVDDAVKDIISLVKSIINIFSSDENLIN